jgi:NitT/TauT family transport system ATP-binding protein
VTGPAILEASGARLVYRTARGHTVALDGVDLQVEEGAFVSLLGASGCGKSSLLKMFAGLLAPTAGAISLSGRPVAGPSPRLGVAFQRPTLMPWKTVLENTLVPARAQRRDIAACRARAQALLAMVGLEGFTHAYPHELSGGMQQRVGLARMLVAQPDVLLLDEPFSALDPLTREVLMVELQQLWLTERRTVLFVTHSIAEAAFLSDRVLVMSPRPGRIAAEIAIDLPRPRTLAAMETPEFAQLTGRLRRALGDAA